MAFSSNTSGSVITLTDTATNTFAEVFAFGALLNQFTVQHNHTAFNVVDGFSSTSEATEKLTPFFKGAKLSPFVCRINNGRYTFGEKNYLLSKYYFRGDALHGLIYDALFTVVENSSDDTSATVKLEYVYDDKTEGFPFKYKCTVEYKLAASNALTVSTTIQNLNEGLMPVTDGWHPYFSLRDTIDDYQLEFQSREILEFSDNLIPTGNFIPYQEFGSLRTLGPALLDSCFTLDFTECQPLCVVRNPLKKIQLEIYPSSSYPYLQIYTPDHRKSIAIENLSAAPDAFNNGLGLRVLQSNESATFSTKFIIHSL